MLVDSMKPGTVYRCGDQWYMRIQHNYWNSVHLERGFMVTHSGDYATFSKSIESLEATKQVRFHEIMIGTVCGHRCLRVAGGWVSLDKGVFHELNYAAKCWVDTWKLVITAP